MVNKAHYVKNMENVLHLPKGKIVPGSQIKQPQHSNSHNLELLKCKLEVIVAKAEGAGDVTPDITQIIALVKGLCIPT